MRLQQKRFHSFRQRRINDRAETRRQLALRTKLERRLSKRLNTLFRKFVNVQLHLYREFGIYEESVANRNLNEEFMPVILVHYRRIFQVVYKANEDKYFNNQKQEALVFGRSTDFEALVENYFNSRQLVLTGITAKLSARISRLIEQGRADNLTLPEIAKLVSSKFLPISRSRASLIARTETHNASSFANHSYHRKLKDDTGIKMMKKWVATNDARTRSFHASANGQIVDMDEDFIVNGMPMGYAGDPRGGVANVINCRCVIVYADERDMN